MIWWCRSDPINFSVPCSQIADLTLALFFTEGGSHCQQTTNPYPNPSPNTNQNSQVAQRQMCESTEGASH